METPVKVKQAVTAILATLAISTLLALYQKLSGNTSAGQFLITIIIYAFLCILPYKISPRRADSFTVRRMKTMRR